MNHNFATIADDTVTRFYLSLRRDERFRFFMNSPRFNRDCAPILGIGAAPAEMAVGEVSHGNGETRVTGEIPRGPVE
jgi:hypothetical protein